MDLEKRNFCIVADKELALNMLRLNNIQAMEVVNAEASSYPMIGRKFGHHGGRDLSVVHTKEQGLDEGYDYFTILYNFEQEYRLEIKGLSCIKVEEALADTAICNEIPIRTPSFGWKWTKVDINMLQSDWINMAIRAVYLTGLTHAYVKIGRLENDSVILIDVNSITNEEGKREDLSSKPNCVPQKNFTIGADVEFMLSCDDELLPASEFFPLEGLVGCDERQIEQDSGEYALAEMRPNQAETPQELFENIKKCLIEASEKIPYENIAFRAGSMPFFGYQCGGHVHFGVKPSVELLRALDYFLAIPLAMIEVSSTSRRRRKTKHGGLGRIRMKPYGFEYVSLSSWIVKPEIALATVSLAYLIAIEYPHLQTNLLYDPLVQRSYYQGNQIALKYLWNNIKEQLVKTESFSLYEKEIYPLIESIENDRLLKETTNIRETWGLETPAQTYERGLIIQIPKKIRKKFQLKEGDETYVCAGKSIARAIIRPYPFTFRNSNIIQLSPALRNELSVPKDWIPKISSANGAVVLGPIMGILTDRPLNRQATYFQHLSKIAKKKQMLLYVFEPKDILWEQKLIKGTTIDGDGLFPFPAVIYDRYFWKNKQQKIELAEARAQLQFVYNIPFINQPTLFDLTGNKWSTHQILMENHPEYLPETRLLNQPADITEMLNRYGEIFIKPLGGALSKGIIRVMQTPTGLFWMDAKQRNFQQFHSIENLLEMFFPLKPSKKFLVQEAIKRKQLNGNHVELRSYMQKNGQQKWVRTGMISRLTNEGVMSEETEINKKSSYVLNKLFDDPAVIREIKNQITKLTKSVVDVIEAQVGPFGELAVDVCIDQYNHIKILEINAKPDNLFSQVKAYKLRNLAALRLLNYATSLAGCEADEKGGKET